MGGRERIRVREQQRVRKEKRVKSEELQVSLSVVAQKFTHSMHTSLTRIFT